MSNYKTALIDAEFAKENGLPLYTKHLVAMDATDHIATQAAAIEALEEHNQNAQSLNGLLELRVEELKGLLERGYSLVKPPPVQERFKNIVGKARAAWLTDVLEVLTQETKDGN